MKVKIRLAEMLEFVENIFDLIWIFGYLGNMGKFDFIEGATRNELIEYIKYAQICVQCYEKSNDYELVDYYFALGGEAYDEWVRRGYKLKAIEKYRWL